MENRIEMMEVFSARDVRALKGCTITSVTDEDINAEDIGLCLNCKDANGNTVILSISEDGAWHFYDSKKENITAEQFGELAMLAGCSDIDSVHFNRADHLTEIVIRPIGSNAADRVLAILRGIFKMLEVKQSDWEFEGETCPMYCCSDPNYYYIITVAVMPGDVFKDIGRN